MNNTGVLLIGLIVIGAGGVLHLVGLTQAKYSVLKGSDSKIYKGPLKGCASVNIGIKGLKLDRDPCVELEFGEQTGEYKAMAGSAWLAVFLSVAAVGMVAVNLLLSVVSNEVGLVTTLSAAAACVAGVFALVSLAMWVANHHNSDIQTIGSSFYMSLVGGILLLVGGGQVAGTTTKK